MSDGITRRALLQLQQQSSSAIEFEAAADGEGQTAEQLPREGLASIREEGLTLETGERNGEGRDDDDNDNEEAEEEDNDEVGGYLPSDREGVGGTETDTSHLSSSGAEGTTATTGSRRSSLSDARAGSAYAPVTTSSPSRSAQSGVESGVTSAESGVDDDVGLAHRRSLAETGRTRAQLRLPPVRIHQPANIPALPTSDTPPVLEGARGPTAADVLSPESPTSPTHTRRSSATSRALLSTQPTAAISASLNLEGYFIKVNKSKMLKSKNVRYAVLRAAVAAPTISYFRSQFAFETGQPPSFSALLTADTVVTRGQSQNPMEEVLDIRLPGRHLSFSTSAPGQAMQWLDALQEVVAVLRDRVHVEEHRRRALQLDGTGEVLGDGLSPPRGATTRPVSPGSKESENDNSGFNREASRALYKASSRRAGVQGARAAPNFSDSTMATHRNNSSVFNFSSDASYVREATKATHGDGSQNQASQFIDDDGSGANTRSSCGASDAGDDPSASSGIEDKQDAAPKAKRDLVWMCRSWVTLQWARKGQIIPVKRFVNSHPGLADEHNLLRCAVRYKNWPLARYFIEERGVNPNFMNKYGIPLLWFSVMWGGTEDDGSMLRYLIAQGADVHARSTYGMTILYWVVLLPAERAIPLLRLLVRKCKVNVQATDHWNSTILHWAVMQGDLDIVQFITGRLNGFTSQRANWLGLIDAMWTFSLIREEHRAAHRQWRERKLTAAATRASPLSVAVLHNSYHIAKHLIGISAGSHTSTRLATRMRRTLFEDANQDLELVSRAWPHLLPELLDTFDVTRRALSRDMPEKNQQQGHHHATSGNRSPANEFSWDGTHEHQLRELVRDTTARASDTRTVVTASASEKLAGGYVEQVFDMRLLIGSAKSPVNSSPLAIFLRLSNPELFDHRVLRLIVQLKWSLFGRSRYLKGLMLYIVFCCAFLAGFAFDAHPAFRYFTITLALFFLFTDDFREIQNAPSVLAHFRSPWSWMSLLSYLIITASGVADIWLDAFHNEGSSADLYGRYSDVDDMTVWTQLWRICLSFAALCIFLRGMLYMSVWKDVGMFLAVVRIMINDTARWAQLLVVLYLAFAVAFFTLLRGFDRFKTLWDAVVEVFSFSMGEMALPLLGDDSSLETFAEIILMCFMLAVHVIYINILIAMMSERYQRVASVAEAEEVIHRAEAVLRWEATMSESERREHYDLFRPDRDVAGGRHLQVRDTVFGRPVDVFVSHRGYARVIEPAKSALDAERSAASTFKIMSRIHWLEMHQAGMMASLDTLQARHIQTQATLEKLIMLLVSKERSKDRTRTTPRKGGSRGRSAGGSGSGRGASSHSSNNKKGARGGKGSGSVIGAGGTATAKVATPRREGGSGGASVDGGSAWSARSKSPGPLSSGKDSKIPHFMRSPDSRGVRSPRQRSNPKHSQGRTDSPGTEAGAAEGNALRRCDENIQEEALLQRSALMRTSSRYAQAAATKMRLAAGSLDTRPVVSPKRRSGHASNTSGESAEFSSIDADHPSLWVGTHTRPLGRVDEAENSDMASLSERDLSRAPNTTRSQPSEAAVATVLDSPSPASATNTEHPLERGRERDRDTPGNVNVLSLTMQGDRGESALADVLSVVDTHVLSDDDSSAETDSFDEDEMVGHARMYFHNPLSADPRDNAFGFDLTTPDASPEKQATPTRSEPESHRFSSVSRSFSATKQLWAQFTSKSGGTSARNRVPFTPPEREGVTNRTDDDTMMTARRQPRTAAATTGNREKSDGNAEVAADGGDAIHRDEDHGDDAKDLVTGRVHESVPRSESVNTGRSPAHASDALATPNDTGRSSHSAHQRSTSHSAAPEQSPAPMQEPLSQSTGGVDEGPRFPPTAQRTERAGPMATADQQTSVAKTRTTVQRLPSKSPNAQTATNTSPTSGQAALTQVVCDNKELDEQIGIHKHTVPGLSIVDSDEYDSSDDGSATGAVHAQGHGEDNHDRGDDSDSACPSTVGAQDETHPAAAERPTSAISSPLDRSISGGTSPYESDADPDAHAFEQAGARREDGQPRDDDDDDDDGDDDVSNGDDGHGHDEDGADEVDDEHNRDRGRVLPLVPLPTHASSRYRGFHATAASLEFSRSGSTDVSGDGVIDIHSSRQGQSRSPPSGDEDAFDFPRRADSPTGRPVYEGGIESTQAGRLEEERQRHRRASEGGLLSRVLRRAEHKEAGAGSPTVHTDASAEDERPRVRSAFGTGESIGGLENVRGAAVGTSGSGGGRSASGTASRSPPPVLETEDPDESYASEPGSGGRSPYAGRARRGKTRRASLDANILRNMFR